VYFLVGTVGSVLIALLEIQIEGVGGWAKNLPTWRINLNIPFFKKQLTGYHTYFWLLTFHLTHLIFMFTEWTAKKELLLVSFYFYMWLIEDFLWFVFNPKYGIKKFNKKHVPWHKDWFMFVPVDYYLGLIIWGITFYFSIS